MSAPNGPVKAYLESYLREKYQVEVGVGDIDDMDLISLGIISSLGYIELITSIEERFEIEIDFDEIDPSEFTTMSGLVRLVEKTKGNLVE
jgi:acyl carrier protein